MTFSTTFRHGDRVQIDERGEAQRISRGTFQHLSREVGQAVVEFDGYGLVIVPIDRLRHAPATNDVKVALDGHSDAR